MREALRRAVSRWVEVVLARPRATLVASALAALALGAAAAGLDVEGGPEAFLPSGDRHLAGYAAAFREFGLAEMAHADLESDHPAALHDAAAALEDRMRASHLFSEVLGPPAMAELIATGTALRPVAPLLLDDAGLRALDARLDDDDLADRMERHLERLNSPAGGMYQDVFREDPLEIAGLALERAFSGAGTGAAGARRGRLVSADGRHALVAARVAAPVGDARAAAELTAFFETAEAALPRGVRMEWAGGHRFQRDNEATARADVTRVSLAGVAAVAAVVVLAFGRVRLALLALGVMVAAGLAAGAAAAIAFRPVAGVALAFGSALTGISVDYVLHLHSPRRRGERRGEAVRRGCSETGPTVVLGAVTSAAGFLVLLLSDVPAHRMLGVVAAAGIGGALLYALGPGPVLACLTRRDRVARASPLPPPAQRMATALARVVLPRPGASAVLGGLLVAASVPGLLALRFEGDLRRFDAKSPATLAAEARIAETWGGIAGASAVIVRGADADAALAGAEAAVAALEPFRGRGIDGVISPTAVLPSRATRERRRAAWAAFWDPARRERARTALARAAAPLSIRPDVFEPFFLSLDRPVPDPDPAVLEATALGPLVRRHLRRGPDGALALLLVPGGGTPDGRAPWVDAVRASGPGIEPVTGGGLAAAIVDAARSELQGLALPALGAVALLLLLYYRRPGPVAAGVAPLVGGVAVTGGVLGYAGVPLSVMNVVAALPVFGLGVDYAIFLVDALADAPRDGGAVESVGRRSGPALAAALTTAVGVGAMLLADHPSVFALGLALTLGVVSTFVLAWLLVPALAGWKGRDA